MPVQNTDISGNPFGIQYSAPGLTWKILQGVEVFGTSGAVSSAHTDSTLVNKGSLFGAEDFGVQFDAGNAFGALVVKNKGSGEIRGETTGVSAIDFLGSLRVENKGMIEAEIGIDSEGSSDVEIVNTGQVSGYYAVYIDVDSAGAKDSIVKNYGILEAEGIVVKIGGSIDTHTKVLNYSGGKIIGGEFAINTNGSLTLKNEGKIVGRIETGEYDDKVINKKTIKGDVSLREGDDIFKNKDKGKVAGLVDSGYGNDKLVLGSKKDMLLFNSEFSESGNVDTIKHFESGKDVFYFNENYFSSMSPGPVALSEFRVGSSAQDADDYLIYDKSSGALYYDPDGIGGDNQIKFAQFNPGTKLKAADILVGDYSTDLPL